MTETRKRCCTRRSEIRAELAELRKSPSPEPGKDPFADLGAKRKKEQQTKTGGPTEQPDATAETTPKDVPGKEENSTAPSAGGPGEGSTDTGLEQSKAESIKNQIIQASGSWGFSYETEKSVNEVTGRVHLVLTWEELVIACEISATTRAEHEFERSVKKCLQAGFERIFVICNAPKRRAKIQEMVADGCTFDEQRRIHCVTVDEFLGSLSGLGAAHHAKQAGSTAGSEPKQATQGLDVSEAERQRATKKIWEDINRRKKKDRGESE